MKRCARAAAGRRSGHHLCRGGAAAFASRLYARPGSRTKLAPIVSSGKAAALITRWWKEKYSRLPDAFVVEGPLAGGHLGFKPEQIFDPALQPGNILARDVLGETQRIRESGGPDIPVIAAGGIYTGEDIRTFLDLGADAVQMATRFVATRECDASDAFKQAYIDCGQEDIVIVKSPVGMPGRALSNALHHRDRPRADVARPLPLQLHRFLRQRKKPLLHSGRAAASPWTAARMKGWCLSAPTPGAWTDYCPLRDLIRRLEQEYHQITGWRAGIHALPKGSALL